MLYRVALQGFAESERRSLASLLRETSRREPGYQPVRLLTDADVILADGDSTLVVTNVVDEARVGTTLFSSEHRPPEAAWRRWWPPARRLRSRLMCSCSTRAMPRATTCARCLSSSASVPTRRATVPKALWLVETRLFEVAFLDVALDGSDNGTGIELCQRVRDGAQRLPERIATLFIMSAQAQPADRVRAALAGANAFLIKPLGRGDVAQALESCGVAMRLDRRHG